MSKNPFSRRSFLAMAAASPVAGVAGFKKIPIGLELYSVRGELAKDLEGTVRTVAKMGYGCVEFYAPYYKWTPARAKQVRSLLDDLGIRCYSTHNSNTVFDAGNLDRAIELNKIIGSGIVVMASPGKVVGIDGYKAVAEKLTRGAEKLRSAGLQAGFHNHRLTFTMLDGQLPLEVIARGTPKDLVLQLDVGTCVEAGQDPVAWIKDHPGRIQSIHCKDWSKAGGYKVLFGDGEAPWKAIFAAAESVGGVKFYLIEQEGSRYAPFETVKRCLASIRKTRA